MNSNDTNAINKGRYRVVSDKLTDGDDMSISSNTKLKPGDSLTVTLESIDESTFNFFNTLSSVLGEGSSFMSAPPENPVSNISNGALGYFAAYSFTQRKFVIQ